MAERKNREKLIENAAGMVFKNPSWLEDISKKFRNTNLQDDDVFAPAIPGPNNSLENITTTGNSTRVVQPRRSSFEASLEGSTKTRSSALAHSADYTRRKKGHTSIRRKQNLRKSLDWGDALDPSEQSNDFLSDLLPHYVTPRHSNKPIDEDFEDVIVPPHFLAHTKNGHHLSDGSKLKITQSNKKRPSKLSKSIKMDVQEPDKNFVIPELPKGKTLEIKIFTNWGDKNCVGLNGIEIFDSTGEPVLVDKIWTESECGDQSDICSVERLLDGVVRTQDDKHAWAAPVHILPCSITLMLARKSSIALIRIWNYNKSRIHSSRGVRLVQLRLDDELIFHGEIERSCGELNGSMPSFGDTILFTKNEIILESVMSNDKNFQSLLIDSMGSNDRDMTKDRPPTANDQLELQVRGPCKKLSLNKATKYVAKTIKLTLMSNWGQGHLIGLTGIEIYSNNNPVGVYKAFAYRARAMDDQPPLLESLMECKSLFNGANLSTNFEDMWCTSYSPSAEYCHIVMDLKEPKEITGIRIWNYNVNMELTYAGAKHVKIDLDQEPLNYRPVVLRRAPGNVFYNFVQELELAALDDRSDDDHEVDSFQMDCLVYGISDGGFVYQIVLFSTWGDPYYIGLTSIQLFDKDGNKIQVRENNICAHPSSVNILEGGSRDARTPDKLIDDVNSHTQPAHSWLAPVLPNTLNRIYFVFDLPVAVHSLLIWNYAKTPTRGVKEFGVLVDDLLIHNGVLSCARREEPLLPQRVHLYHTEGDSPINKSEIMHHNNDYRVTTSGSVLSTADQSLRPRTGVPL